MSTAPENFDGLKQLLALKRHEQPPPGYFENFSSKVCARIEAAPKLTWWQQVAAAFALKPAAVALCGAAICGTLVFGVHLANNTPQQAANPELKGSVLVTSTPGPIDPGLSTTGTTVQTNPAPASAPPFLFNPPSARETERVNFPANP